MRGRQVISEILQNVYRESVLIILLQWQFVVMYMVQSIATSLLEQSLYLESGSFVILCAYLFVSVASL
jgi:hypothetical protein